MRMTVNLPDDVADLVRSVANAKGISMGSAIAELVRQAVKRDADAPDSHSFPYFTVPADAAPITLEQTLAAEDNL
jgi:metal-responsive CopG/Arc/MetJ family transcriptional regulator